MLFREGKARLSPKREGECVGRFIFFSGGKLQILRMRNEKLFRQRGCLDMLGLAALDMREALAFWLHNSGIR